MPLDRVFRALADPRGGRSCSGWAVAPPPVSELSQPFPMALPSFSQHLAVLERCGLVRSRKTGRVRTYRLAPRPLKAAEQWMVEQRTIWERRLDQLDQVLSN